MTILMCRIIDMFNEVCHVQNMQHVFSFWIIKIINNMKADNIRQMSMWGYSNEMELLYWQSCHRRSWVWFLVQPSDNHHSPSSNTLAVISNAHVLWNHWPYVELETLTGIMVWSWMGRGNSQIKVMVGLAFSIK